MPIKLFDSLETAAERVPSGSIKKLIIKDQEYAIVHNSSGLHVVSNFCPHRQEALNKGTLNAFNEIICPLHQYRFNLNTGQEVNNRCGHLPVIPIQINSEGVFVDL